MQRITQPTVPNYWQKYKAVASGLAHPLFIHHQIPDLKSIVPFHSSDWQKNIFRTLLVQFIS